MSSAISFVAGSLVEYSISSKGERTNMAIAWVYRHFGLFRLFRLCGRQCECFPRMPFSSEIIYIYIYIYTLQAIQYYRSHITSKISTFFSVSAAPTFHVSVLKATPCFILKLSMRIRISFPCSDSDVVAFTCWGLHGHRRLVCVSPTFVSRSVW